MPGRLIAALLLCTFIIGARAEAPAAPKQTREQFEASLNYQHGNITLPGGRATLQVPETFRYLAPVDAQRVLVDAWGNPPNKDVLGMLFPAATGPLDKNGWGIVITYSDDGHVSDADADAIDFTKLQQDMQEASVQANAERKKQGYEEVHLLGWAEPPHYDKQNKKLYWAQEARFGDSTRSTLNYNIRILGRNGVLVLNAVAGIDQLATVKAGMPAVVGFTNFVDGNRYADFNPSTDKVAAYGLAALIGGGIAAKTGLLAKAVAMLIAGKKAIILALSGLGVGIKRMLGKKQNTSA